MPDASTMGWILAAITMGGSAIWAVATIKGATRELRMSIDGLSGVVGKLETAIEKIETRQIDHEVRIALLERQGQ